MIFGNVFLPVYYMPLATSQEPRNLDLRTVAANGASSIPITRIAQIMGLVGAQSTHFSH